MNLRNKYLELKEVKDTYHFGRYLDKRYGRYSEENEFFRKYESKSKNKNLLFLIRMRKT